MSPSRFGFYFIAAIAAQKTCNVANITGDSPIILALASFGLDVSNAAAETDNPVHQCLASISPEYEMLEECLPVLPSAFGSDGFLTQLTQLVDTMAPVKTILREGPSDDLLTAFDDITDVLTVDSLNQMCTLLDRHSDCLTNVFDAMEMWLDGTNGCCDEMRALLVPQGHTWSYLFRTLFLSLQDTICSPFDPCDTTGTADTCGSHFIYQMLLFLSKDPFSDAFLTIPNGPQSCKAFSGQVFNTTAGTEATLFDFGCTCANKAVSFAQELKEIPIFSGSVGNCEISMRPDGKCYSFPTEQCSCNVSAECSSEAAQEDDENENENSSASTTTISLLLFLIGVSILSWY